MTESSPKRKCTSNDDDQDNDNENDTKTTKKKMHRSREYAFTLDELKQRQILARFAVEGRLHVSRMTHPFPIPVLNDLLYDLYDTSDPPTKEEEVDPVRIRIIVDILWDVVRCQNRLVTRPHADEAKFPSISVMFRRNGFFQRLALAADLPGVSIDTQIVILNIFTLCTHCAPARVRLARSGVVAKLLAKFLTLNDDSQGNVLLRDEAVLRCLVNCRDWIKVIDDAAFTRINKALCERIRHWDTSPRLFQMACYILTRVAPYWFTTLVSMHTVLCFIIDTALGPQSTNTDSVRAVMRLVHILVTQPTYIATYTLTSHTQVLRLLTDVIAHSTDSDTATSAAISVSNICYDLTITDAIYSIKESLVELGPLLLARVHSSSHESVRFESFVALVMWIQMLNAHVSDQSVYTGSWTDLLDWPMFGLCAFEYLETGTRSSSSPHFDLCLAAASAARTVAVRLGSCAWLRPNIHVWLHVLGNLASSSTQPIDNHKDKNDDDNDTVQGVRCSNTVPYQVRCVASTLMSTIAAYQFFLDPLPIDMQQSFTH